MPARSRRVVGEDEDLDMSEMMEKASQGAVWYGSDTMNIGWPDELVISGRNLIRLLERQRDKHGDEVREANAALDSHRVPAPEGLSLADRIHLLVGRKTR